MKCDELESFTSETFGDGKCEVYDAVEVDAAIAELKQKLQDVAWNKYKRCLAMAKECEATALWCYQAANTLPTGFKATLFGKPVMIEPDRLYNRFERLMKWRNRWFKIAEQFKDKE